MPTTSDNLKPLRVFLAQHSAVPVELLKRPNGEAQETWRIEGKEIMAKIAVGGTWEAFIQASESKDVRTQVIALGNFVMGHRPDLDALNDVGQLAQTLLDRIKDLPGCSDPGCKQQACQELKALRAEINKFLDRLTPDRNKGDTHVRD